MSEVKIKIYHEHKYGITDYNVWVPVGTKIETGSYSGENMEDAGSDFNKVLEKIGCDFDPERNEFVTVEIDDDSDDIVLTESDINME